MTHSTANQASHSKLLDSENSLTETSGAHCDDISVKQRREDIGFLLALAFFNVILVWFSLLLFFINTDSINGLFCA
ncbi:hypothetical protein [Shewanella frigidimarina]|uniref:hypothetical protein n=1 Tax=Shewanella frigidimarina TaxID=56812 RepID=UPI003D78C6CD